MDVVGCLISIYFFTILDLNCLVMYVFIGGIP